MFPLHVAWKTGPPEARYDPTRAEHPTAFPQQQPQEYAHADGVEQGVSRERGERDTGIRQGEYWHDHKGDEGIQGVLQALQWGVGGIDEALDLGEHMHLFWFQQRDIVGLNTLEFVQVVV